MGGAKFMGRDKGTPHSKELLAFELFWYWLIGGLFISPFLSILIFPEPNFVFPIFFYLIGVVLLFIRYIKVEKRSLNK